MHTSAVRYSLSHQLLNSRCNVLAVVLRVEALANDKAHLVPSLGLAISHRLFGALECLGCV